MLEKCTLGGARRTEREDKCGKKANPGNTMQNKYSKNTISASTKVEKMQTRGGRPSAAPQRGRAPSADRPFCVHIFIRFLTLSVLFPHFSGTCVCFRCSLGSFFCTFLILFRHIPGNPDFVLFLYFFDTLDLLQDLWGLAVTQHHNYRW